MPENRPFYIVDLSARGPDGAVHVEGDGDVLVSTRELDTPRMPAMCADGHCRVRLSGGEGVGAPVTWDDGPPWQLELAVDGDRFLTGKLVRGDESMALDEPRVLHQAGLLYIGNTLARFDH